MWDIIEKSDVIYPIKKLFIALKLCKKIQKKSAGCRLRSIFFGGRSSFYYRVYRKNLQVCRYQKFWFYNRKIFIILINKFKDLVVIAFRVV